MHFLYKILAPKITKLCFGFEIFWASRTPRVNFINVLLKAFMCTDPKSAKYTDDFMVFFAHLGSAQVKTELRMLMILTPCFVA
jgi:hypothetical protein